MLQICCRLDPVFFGDPVLEGEVRHQFEKKTGKPSYFRPFIGAPVTPYLELDFRAHNKGICLKIRCSFPS